MHEKVLYRKYVQIAHSMRSNLMGPIGCQKKTLPDHPHVPRDVYDQRCRRRLSRMSDRWERRTQHHFRSPGPWKVTRQTPQRLNNKCLATRAYNHPGKIIPPSQTHTVGVLHAGCGPRPKEVMVRFHSGKVLVLCATKVVDKMHALCFNAR